MTRLTLTPSLPKTPSTSGISFAGAFAGTGTGGTKAKFNSHVSTAVNTWPGRHLRVLVTAVTHHCLMKLETEKYKS